MKVCSKCHEVKGEYGFYKDKRSKSGLKSQCKKCHIKTAIATRNENNSRLLRRESAARTRANDIERFRKKDRLASRKRPKTIKTEARAILNRAVGSGKIKKPKSCQHCSKPIKLTAHHRDYKKPLVVIWLCYLCHAAEHRHERIMGSNNG